MKKLIGLATAFVCGVFLADKVKETVKIRIEPKMRSKINEAVKGKYKDMGVTASVSFPYYQDIKEEISVQEYNNIEGSVIKKKVKVIEFTKRVLMPYMDENDIEKTYRNLIGTDGIPELVDRNKFYTYTDIGLGPVVCMEFK